MILVDTSIWVEHLRGGDARLTHLLEVGEVLCHPLVIGELVLGGLADDGEAVSLLGALPRATPATADEVLRTIHQHRLARRGVGYVDAHLVAATLLTPDASLATLDRRLAGVAEDLGLAAPT